MNDWKGAGRAAKSVEDALWTQFKAAQDAFFAARSAALNERDTEFTANLAAKEALLAEAEKLDPNADFEGAQAAFRVIQEKWSAIGKVPRESIKAVDNRLDAVASKFTAITSARWKQVSTSSSPLVIRLKESIEKLERKLDKAKANGDAAAIADLEGQLETQRTWLAQAD